MSPLGSSMTIQFINIKTIKQNILKNLIFLGVLRKTPHYQYHPIYYVIKNNNLTYKKHMLLQTHILLKNK